VGAGVDTGGVGVLVGWPLPPNPKKEEATRAIIITTAAAEKIIILFNRENTMQTSSFGTFMAR
jgi:hypothetical protein